MPFVQCQDGLGLVPVGQHDEGGICQSERQITVALDHCPSPDQIVYSQRRQLVGTRGKLAEQGQLGIYPGKLCREVVQFGQDKRR